MMSVRMTATELAVLNRVSKAIETSVGFFSLEASHWRRLVRKAERGAAMTADEQRVIVGHVMRWAPVTSRASGGR